MSIGNIKGYRPSFGYKTLLKDLYMKGELPTVKVGLYNKPLSKKNCSNEHLVPKSLGGTLEHSNIALGDKFINNLRGTKDLRLFTNLENIIKYLKQFINVVIKKNNKIIFNGNDYIKEIIPTFQKIGFPIDIGIIFPNFKLK